MALPFAPPMTTAPGPSLQYRGDTSISRPRSPRLGRFCRLLLPPGPTSSDDRSLQMSGVALFSGGNLSRGEREDRSNRWVLVAFAIIGLLAACSGLQTGRRSGRSMRGYHSLAWCRSLPPAVPLRLWPVFLTGSAGWSPSSPGIRWSRLVSMALSATRAILGLLVNSLGWALAFRSSVGVLLTALLIPRSSRACARKKHCCAHFGGEYDAYCARASRLIPGLY